MAEKEMVTIEMTAENRMRLVNQIDKMLELSGKAGISEETERFLLDSTRQLTVNELIVLAARFKMDIVIQDINFVPRKEN